jgi:hypothetical protein
MARYSVGARAAAIGSATIPLGSLYATASVNFRLREVGVFNTTTTAVVVAMCRLTTTGTRGSTLTEFALDHSSVAASAEGFNSHTVGPTLADGGYRATLGAAAGAGVIWTFGGDAGINVNAATTNGIGIYTPTGTGQICDFYFVWDE